jgi:ABC-2 type transport system ATP-binding protein
VTGLEVRDLHVRCEVDTEHLGILISTLSACGIVSLTSRPPTLEELFLRHYEDEPGSAAAPVGAAR